MKTKILFLFLMAVLVGCDSDDINMDTNAPNQVLMLKVDYTTNVFEGGTIFGFSRETDNFTIENEYIEPSDFGSVKLFYKELDQMLFYGTIHWMGVGEMIFPAKLEPASSFEYVATEDIHYPAGFENVFNPHNQELHYDKAWLSVQGLVKVREFLTENPNQKVKLFLYTPSVGAGDPKDWYWVIYLNK